MLHVTTEIGKVGRKERERRHFPNVHNYCSAPSYRARGRRYIPHGYGFYDEWTPHNQNINIRYTENGPDWKSQLKYIPDPENPKYPAAEIFENNWKAMRPYPNTYMRTRNEWLLDPGLTKVGLRCNFDGVHRATNTSSDEITHRMLFGRGRNETIIDKRNGIPYASEGDKSYQAVEYSPSFHKGGSSLPSPQFGANYPKVSTDTSVPLLPLPKIRRDTFREMEKRRQMSDEIDSVRGLEAWEPAKPIHQALIPEDPPAKK
ncbi:spermatogenesis-associated serine-rich protein 1-like isoform X3 [Crassostrea virginica]|uniref:Spermatogenesis-associated serine-rich protein 1-like isoform X11 n=1 Tax=Crassostrea virginica TaxID=6565 RepID=A0A8B8AEF9_CRAVI|nr:spermatogenesis-associated serine-rich protein 1-like isoform X11 [Crassostrea virginica]XP_022288888.1 spermatogenesis-associated serine-rich protein 1-like isoform X7 [Crassostrea virginica]